MTIAAEIGRRVATAETILKATDFVDYAKGVAARGHGLPELRVRSRVATLLKSPVTPAALADPNWTALADYREVAAAWLSTLARVSIFDAALAGGMVRVPLHSRIVAAASAITGSTPNEREVKPISSFTLEADAITPRKSAALIVVTKELFELSGGPGAQLFGRELLTEVSVATDREFLTALYGSVTPSASAGATTANTLTDLAALLNALTVGIGSKVFVAMSPANLAKLMTKVTTGSGTAYPGLSLAGGEWLNGITVMPTDALPSGAIIAFDASGFAGGTELPTVVSARHANVQMDTAPDSPATTSTTNINLWQQNMVGLMAERWYGWVQFRAGSVAAISGASY